MNLLNKVDSYITLCWKGVPLANAYVTKKRKCCEHGPTWLSNLKGISVCQQSKEVIIKGNLFYETTPPP